MYNTFLYFLFKVNEKRHENYRDAEEIVGKKLNAKESTHYIDPVIVKRCYQRIIYPDEIEKRFNDEAPFLPEEERMVCKSSLEFLYVGEPVTKKMLENQLMQISDTFLDCWERRTEASGPLRGYTSLVLKEYLKMTK